MAFCPNCGSQQPDGTPACTKCNTPLTVGAAAGGKFKGTIMMGGTSAEDVDAMVQKAKAAAAQTGGRVAAPAPSRPAPVPASVAPAAAAAQAASGAAAAGDDALAYQATIMGPITSPSGGGPAEFPHPLFGGGEAAAPAGSAPTDEDPIHSAPTMGFEPSGEGGPTIVDGGAPEAMAAIADDRASLPVKGGKGGLILVLIIVGVLVLAGIGIGAFFWLRTPDVPQYPGYPMPGQVMPGQVPGQVPGYPMPGQVPMPGQMPAPGQMPGAPTPPPAQ